MPSDYRIDAERRLVLIRSWGVITDDQIIAFYDRLRADPAYTPAYPQIIDMRAVTDATRLRGDLPRRSWPNHSAAGIRRAFVAPPGYIFGVARQNATYGELDGADTAVFDSLAGAEEWLGLPPGGSGLIADPPISLRP